MAGGMRLGLALAAAMGIAMTAWWAARWLVLAQAPPLADAEPLAFTLDEMRYSMLVPKGLRLREDAGGCRMFWYPNTRLVKFFTLCSAAGAVPATLPRLETLPNGARVGYAIDRQLDGSIGSGGPEGELKGLLELNGKTIAITCHDQHEWGARPEWCLRYLGSLRAKGDRSRPE